MAFKIPREVLQATLNYLATQPYSDVVQLINELQRLEPLDQQAPIRPSKDEEK
ncbi:MAG: hypothetical protein ACMXYD_02055 [Candidatus Woesearchaeota archaeon]